MKRTNLKDIARSEYDSKLPACSIKIRLYKRRKQDVKTGNIIYTICQFGTQWIWTLKQGKEC